MKLWCDDQILVTVDGPDARRKLTVRGPFARVGAHPNSEVVLGEGAGQRAYYLHVENGGIYAHRLEGETGNAADCGRWLAVAEPIAIGPYRVTARLKSQIVAPPALPSLVAAGSADLPLPVLNIFCGPEFKERRRLCSTLTLVGRHPHCALKLHSRKVSLLHCVLVWKERRLWCIDLFSSNGTLLNGQRIDCAEVQMHDRLDAGEIGLVYHRWSPRGSMTPGWQPAQPPAATDEPANRPARPPPGPAWEEARKRLMQEMSEEISRLASHREELQKHCHEAQAQIAAQMDELRDLTHELTQSRKALEAVHCEQSIKRSPPAAPVVQANEHAHAAMNPAATNSAASIPAASIPAATATPSAPSQVAPLAPNTVHPGAAPLPASQLPQAMDSANGQLPTESPQVRGTLVSFSLGDADVSAPTAPEPSPTALAPQPGAFDPGPLAATIDLRSGAEPVPGFRLDCLLGQGMCGVVWKATAPGGIPIALKFVPLAGRAVELKMREIQIAKSVRHANLVSIFSTWQSPDWIVIAMELADRTLMDRYEEAAGQGLPGIPAGELWEYMRDAAKGIDYLNELHVQNRDIKPSNLLLVGGAVKIADFGTARSLHGSVTDSRCLGTPAYAAPEYLLNQTSNRSDQYSLAVTYCELRGGRLPFDGSIVEVYQAHLHNPPQLDMLPESERPAVEKALSKKPRDRWPNCRAFVEAIASGAGSKRKWWRPFNSDRSQQKSK